MHKALLVAALLLALAAPAGAAADRDLLGIVTTPDGAPLTGAVVNLGDQQAVTGLDGRFKFSSAAPGDLTVARPGYAGRTVGWDGTTDFARLPLAPRLVRGLHVEGPAAADPARWEALLVIADDTAVNAVVVDVKDESGKVFPTTDSATALDTGAAQAAFDLAARTEEARDRGLYVIVRIVSFQDPIVGLARPEWAAWNLTANGPHIQSGQVFLDPSDPDARGYVLELAQEACAAGVDEVQFDYVRYPDGPKDDIRFDTGADPATRQATITAFMAEARELLAPRGCAAAADIFGFITSIPGEGGIGQQLEDLGEVTDVLSPMSYPELWSTGWFGFDDPGDHPREVIHRSSTNALARLEGLPTLLRPWLQDFSYTAAQVRAQIEAADQLGLGWMLWNFHSVFTVAGIPTDGELAGQAAPPPAEFLTLPPSGFFDVPAGHRFETEIRWLSDQDITRGCNPPWGDHFCPRDHVTRGQMAAFLVRALGLTAGAGSDRFADDDGTTFEQDIDRLATAGITHGCAVDRYCPADPVTRGQMAAFLVRALGLTAGAGSDRFADDDGTTFEQDIDRLATAGITHGCAADRYCPADPVTRGQMAAFLYRGR